MNEDKNSGKIFDFTNFKRSKAISEELAKGRTPLYLSHLKGRVSGSPHLKGTHKEGFGDRISKIRKSLERINALMTDLKKMPESDHGKRKQK